MSDEPLQWYKREQRLFLSATAGWTLENKGAYSILIDLIMDQPKGLVDNDQWVAGQLGTSVRKWRTIKTYLIEQGKISVNNGIISNKKADKVKINQRLYRDKNAENRKNTSKNKNKAPPFVTSCEDNKILDLDTTNVVSYMSDCPKSSKAKGDAKALAEGFERFWKRYPHKVSKKPATLAFFKAARSHGEQIIMGGLERALSMDRRFTNSMTNDGRCITPHAATWLNAQGFLDEHASSQNGNGTASAGQFTASGIGTGNDRQRIGGLAGAGLRHLARTGGFVGTENFGTANDPEKSGSGEILDLTVNATST